MQRDDTVSGTNPQIAQMAADSKDKQTHAIIGAAMEVHGNLTCRDSWKPFISRRSLSNSLPEAFLFASEVDLPVVLFSGSSLPAPTR